MNPNAGIPLVSVCIQTYQHAAYISECLDSVIAQETDFPFEIILGEDDSTDGTREICKQYRDQFPDKIRLFLRSASDKIYINGEMTGRYNFLQNLGSASGKYIALLDGDDYWTDKKKLQTQFQFMEENPDCSMCFHRVQRQYLQKRVRSFRMQGWPDNDTKYSIAAFFESSVKINSSSTFFRSNNIRDLPAWFRDVPFMDYPLHIHNAQKGMLGFISKTMGVYRINPNGLWSKMKWPQHLFRLWDLYSIMAEQHRGEIAAALKKKRLDTGLSLISYYQQHIWVNRTWYNTIFKNRLQAGQSGDDEFLLSCYTRKRKLKDYAYCGLNLMKRVVRVLMPGH